MSSLHFWKPFLGILFVWALAILLVAPWGNFPLNDDWTYARQVLTFLESGKIEHSNWAAMPFVPQSLFGITLGKLFGFSFVVLRIGTLVLAAVNTFLLYRLLYLHSPRGVAICLSLIFAFNPIYLYLSMTFMTEVYYLFLLLLMLSLMERYFRQPTWWLLACIALVSVGAVLQRQTGIILPISFALVLLLRSKLSPGERLGALIPALCALGALTVYGIWRAQTDADPGHYSSFTDLFASLYDFRLSFFLERGGMLLLYLGLFTAPILILLYRKPGLPKRYGWLALGIVAVLMAFALPNFPRNQVLFNLGIGPRLLKDSMAHQFPFFPQYAYYIVGGISTVFVLSFANRVFAHINFKKKEFLSKIRSQDAAWKILLSIAMLGYVAYLLLNLIFFDRYVLPLLLLLLFFTSLFLQEALHQRIFYTVLGLLLILNCVLLRDHFLWQNTRWKAISDSEKLGIDARVMDAGFEYNCWHNGDPVETQRDDLQLKGWWSVIADDYLLSEDAMDNYTPLRYFPYDPIIGRKDSLVLSVKTSLLHTRP